MHKQGKQFSRQATAGLTISCLLALLQACAAKEGANNVDATSSGGPASHPLSRTDLSAAVVDTSPLFTAQPPLVIVSAAPSAAGPDPSKAKYIVCTRLVADGVDGAIDDLEDGDTAILSKEHRSGGWFSYEETAGSHQMAVLEASGGGPGSHWALHNSAAAHGDWAGFGASLGDCPYDASKFAGIHFWAKGTAAEMHLSANNPSVIPVSEGGGCTKDDEGLCYDTHKALVTLNADWTEYTISFKALKQSGWGFDVGEFKPSEILTVEFQFESDAFDVWIDDLGFYREGVPYYPAAPAGSAS